VTQTVTLGSTNVRLNFSPTGSPGNQTPLEDSYIRRLYLTVLGRAASDAEVGIWRPRVQFAGAAAVANAIERSTEARTRVVRSWYVNYLGRSALNGEEQGWVTALQSGATEEQILSGILGSDEYASRATASGSLPTRELNVIASLFQQFLNRSAGAAELDNFVRNIVPVVGRSGAALIVLTSAEYRAQVVHTYYAQILQRPGTPSPAEVNGWVFSGLDQTTMRIGFEGSTEYFLHG
jgi:hypothetical protein